jgi:hypothetical protein
MTLREWLWNRARETTTHVGGALIVVSAWGLTSTNPTVQQCLDLLSHIGPPVGAFLVGISSKHS